MPTSSGFAGVAWAEGKEEKNNKKKDGKKKEGGKRKKGCSPEEKWKRKRRSFYKGGRGVDATWTLNAQVCTVLGFLGGARRNSVIGRKKKTTPATQTFFLFLCFLRFHSQSHAASLEGGWVSE